ncbi:acyl-CoA thioesterase [Lysobacter psychrotolerans]|uniref:Acyl-CoA thioesterase n=2 Tax=Montanilutibacter psychrotolerans TaxID=1327343 RepID=A0A3M8SVV5_9GAMM|nr:acyl-CoA thioesterase [Lysobacter psychrotolerans]
MAGSAAPAATAPATPLDAAPAAAPAAPVAATEAVVAPAPERAVTQQQRAPDSGKTTQRHDEKPRQQHGKRAQHGAGIQTLIRVPMPVRWRDLDAFNHVNNSKYLSYLEEARLQWMLTVPGQGLDEHVAPVVAAANLNYRRPIEWPNEVMIELFVERLGNTSLSIGHRIVDARDTSVLYCDGQVVMVWIDRGTGAAAPLPSAVRTACA